MVKIKNEKAEFTERLQTACLEAGVAGRGLGKRITDALSEQGIKVSILPYGSGLTQSRFLTHLTYSH